MQRNVLEYLEESARRFPNKIAYTDENVEVTFSDFKNKAQSVAMQILNKIDNINSPIAVFVDRNVDSLIKIKGKLSIRDGERASVLIDNIEPLNEGVQEVRVEVEKPKTLYLKYDVQKLKKYTT